MTKDEVLRLMSVNDLMKVSFGTFYKSYVDGAEVYYDGTFHNRRNVFGVYYRERTGCYVYFHTGVDLGGIIDLSREFPTEDEAYTFMYDYISRKDRLYRVRSKSEVLDRMKRESLMSVILDGCEKEYVNGDDLYHGGVFHGRMNVFGVFKKSLKYVFFVTDSRGSVSYSIFCDDEDKAYNTMYNYVLSAVHSVGQN